MKRILVGGILAVFLVLLPLGPARLAQEKQPAPEEKPKGTPKKPQIRWKKVAEDFQVLKLWEIPELGPKEPQIVILQLSRKRQIELQSDPLKFYKTYRIFDPTPSDQTRGYSVLRLVKDDAGSTDPIIAVVVHDPGTYSGFASFEVADIK
jgi:hypothetical protein